MAQLQTSATLRMYEAQIQAEKIKMEQAGQAMDPRQASPEWVLRIKPAINGGFAIWFDAEMFVVMKPEDIGPLIVTAIVRKKMLQK